MTGSTLCRHLKASWGKKETLRVVRLSTDQSYKDVLGGTQDTNKNLFEEMALKMQSKGLKEQIKGQW